MEILQLKYFSALAKTQHVTKTAETLHIAQPALTQTIHRLEKELGVKLFRPSGRNIVLTESGKYLHERIAPIIKTLDNLPNELRELDKKQHDTLKVNVLAASAVITDASICFKKKCENVMFKFVQNSKPEDADITIFTKELFKEPSHSEETYYVFREEIFLAVPKKSKYSEMKQIALQEVAGMEFISLAGFKALRAICDRWCMYAGFAPDITFESDSPEAVKNLIGASMGVGFWPQYTWGKPDYHNMSLIPIVQPECQRDIIVQLHQGKSALAREYFDYLVNYFEKLRE